jgi:hypothetical protein
MRRIVLPLAAIGAISAADIVDAVAAINVRVAVEVVIHVDINVTAAPAAAPAPATAPRSAHGHANTE